MTTLVEAERQLLELIAAYGTDAPETDDEIDIWSDRMSPFQLQIETAPCASIEDAGVILRHVMREVSGHGVWAAEPLKHVADWLEPGHGLTCADPRILRPCPFCGEREHLTIEEGTFERVGVVDGKVVEITWKGLTPNGAEYADTIQCQVCDTITALDVWNRTRPASDYALLRDFDPPEVEAEAPRQAVAA